MSSHARKHGLRSAKLVRLAGSGVGMRKEFAVLWERENIYCLFSSFNYSVSSLMTSSAICLTL